MYSITEEFSGSIPSTFSNLKHLLTLSLAENLFTSTLPGISSFRNLKVLNLYRNYFNGPVARLFNLSQQLKLVNVDLSANEFTGTLPLELFSVGSLQTVAMVQNCIQGSLSESICAAKNLTALALDGLATASACQIPIWQHNFLGTYQLHYYMSGTLPKCLFEMPKLQVE